MKGLNKMKRLFAILYITFVNINAAFAVTIPASVKQSLKGETDMPSVFNLVISMLIVITMIYFAGWVYQKLNKINKSKFNDDEFLERNTFKILSSQPLGQQKNLYAVEINNKVLVIGATPQSISMLKEFESGEYLAPFFENIEEEIDETDKNLELLYKKYK